MAYILFTLLLSEHPTVSAVVMFIVLPLITWLLYLRRCRSKTLTPATRYVESPRDQR